MSALAAAPRQRHDGTADPETARLLYERYSKPLLGFCLNRLRGREEAEDAVQTTFLHVHDALCRGIVPRHEAAWVYAIAQNVCSTRRASAWRRGRFEAVRDLDALQDLVSAPERGDAVSVSDISTALGALPSTQRRAILLREWQGLSYREIADELGISTSAVETLLFRARRSLARELEPRRSGLVAGVGSVASLLRSFFSGSAVKVAVATAMVAATATVAVQPFLHKPQASRPATRPGPASSPIQAGASALGSSSHAQGISTTRPHVAPSQPLGTPPATAQPTAPSVSGGAVPPVGETSPGPVGALPPHGQPPVQLSLPGISPPTPVTQVSLPDVSVPPVSLPDVPLPAVQLPSVPPVHLPPAPPLP